MLPRPSLSLCSHEPHLQGPLHSPLPTGPELFCQPQIHSGVCQKGTSPQLLFPGPGCAFAWPRHGPAKDPIPLYSWDTHGPEGRCTLPGATWQGWGQEDQSPLVWAPSPAPHPPLPWPPPPAQLPVPNPGLWETDGARRWSGMRKVPDAAGDGFVLQMRF